MRHLFLMLLVMCLGCSSGYAGSIPPLSHAKSIVRLDHADQTRQALMTQYKKWANTPYRSGGMSRKGIDCSGLVHMIFLQKFGIELPRTVARQAKVGKKINKKKLQPGNLVFFKTGARSRHVGIYVGNQKFLHASAKKGVIISTLKNPYWAPKIWKVIKVK
ncbi:MAG: NlpC/P60 family protein [Desulfobacterium sp.]